MAILLWLGSGFAFSVGLILGLFILPWVSRERTKRVDRINDESLDALRTRNRLTLQHTAVLGRIASAIGQLAPRNQFLVMLTGTEDDFPLLLTHDESKAVLHAEKASWAVPAGMAKVWNVVPDIIPVCISIVRFVDGIPIERSVIREYDAEIAEESE